MSPAKLGSAYVAIEAKDELDKGLESAKSKVGSWLQNITQGVAQGVGQVIARGVGELIRGGIDKIGASIQDASNLTESVNKLSVAFGSSAQDILTWSKTSETSLGQSQRQAIDAAASFGLLFKSIGQGSAPAAKMSKSLVQLATDLSSIYNIPIDQALEKLQSGLAGEVRPLRDVNIFLNENQVAQEAVALGLAKSTNAVSDQAKVMARYNLILAQGGVAQGDFAKTSGEIAGQQRILTAEMSDFSATLGSAFTPIYGAILRGLNTLIQQVAPYGDGIIKSLATGMVNGIIYLLPVIAQIRSFFTYWLETHSPPKILPDLAKWGAGALAAYLSGWANPDLDALKNLGGAIENVLRSFVGAGKLGESDLVGRIFGSTQAIANAIDEFRRLGTVSAGSLDAIRRAAGPAGDSVAGLVSSYFDLQKATNAATDAQRELDNVTRAYDARLKPLQDKLDANQAAQQKIRDSQQLRDLGKVINDPTKSLEERRLARLEQEEILTRQQQTAVEKERDAAVDSEQKKLDAAKKNEKAKQDALDQQQAILDQQVKANGLITEQIQLEQKLSDQRKAEQEKAKNLADQLHAALLAYQLSLTDTGGKIAILRGELAKTTEGSADYYQILGQIQGLQDQLAKEQLSEADKVYGAQLNYNLSLADTAGKIAIWRAELAKTTPGTAEYYDILTKIADLLKSQDDGGGLFSADSILPPVDSIDAPGWSKELATKLDQAIKEAFGEKPDFGISIAGGSSLLDKIVGPEPKKVPEVSQNIKDLVDSINHLVTAISTTSTALEALETFFGITGDESALAVAQTQTNADNIVRTTKNTAGLITNLAHGEWAAAFVNLREIVADVLVQIAKLLPGTSGDEPADPNSPIHGLRTMGNAFYGLLAAGMLLGQGPLINSYLAFLKWIRDQLPGSEPKDTSSPLYGLSDAGSSLIGNIWDGIKTKWTEFSGWWTEKMGWIVSQIPALPSWLGGGSLTPSFSGGGSATGSSYNPGQGFPAPMPSVPNVSSLSAQTSTTTSTANLGPFHITVTGNGKVDEAAGRNVGRGIVDELRQRGFKSSAR